MKKIKLLFWLALIGSAVGSIYVPEKHEMHNIVSMIPIGMIVLLFLYYFALSLKVDDVEDVDD